ncbi:MAG: ABC transporter ATP-binding protein [Aggregatilineales bacterium]
MQNHLNTLSTVHASDVPVLHTRDLTIGYAPARKPQIVVKAGIDATLQRGELVCLIGPNGAGKSTLLRTLAGMQNALSGEVLLMDTPIQSFSVSERAKHLSLVLTEHPNTGFMTGYELVTLGRHPYTDWSGRLSDDDERKVMWAVEAVDAVDIAERPVSELSDGQRQKIMIARALAQDPDVMLLDEPTAFLDLPRRVEIMQMLRTLAHTTGSAILLSTHDLDLALRTADRIWLMAEGLPLMIGAPEDLVLEGAFSKAFDSEGVQFDPVTGSFVLRQIQSASIHLSGNGLPYEWTRRALERAGYRLHTDDSADVPHAQISINESANGAVWTLRVGEVQSTHESIYGLIDALR